MRDDMRYEELVAAVFTLREEVDHLKAANRSLRRQLAAARSVKVRSESTPVRKPGGSTYEMIRKMLDEHVAERTRSA